MAHLKKENGHIAKANGRLVNDCDCCGGVVCPGGIPGIDFTLTFAGGGTKDFLGVTFSSGETKTICPTTYTCDITMLTYHFPTTTTYADTRKIEAWVHTTLPSFFIIFGERFIEQYYAYYTNQAQVGFSIPASAYFFGGNFANDGGVPHTAVSTTNISTFLSLAGMTLNSRIPDGAFGQLTTTGGLTIAWARGVGTWNPCGI